MNPTSSLITGGVLLFGVAALANLFLPAPAAPVHAISLASREVPALESTPASETPPSPAVITPAPPVALAPTETPLAARAPVAAPTLPNKPAAESGMHRATSALSNLFTHSKTPATVESAPSTETAPIISTPSAPSALPSATTAAPSVANTGIVAPPPSASGSAAGAVSLSATAQDRAWLRLGDRKTVMAKTGDTVPGLGKITSINADQITIDGRQILKVTP